MKDIIARRLSAFVVCVAILLAASAVFADEPSDIIKLKKDLVIVKDMVVKDVIVVDGNLTVFGRVEGSVVVVGGIITLKPGSYVGGSMVVVGEITKDPAAQVIGEITQVYMPRFIPSVLNFFKGGWVGLWAAFGVLVLVGFLGLAILLIALIPEHTGTIVACLERQFGMMFLWGLLWTALIVPIALFLAISIVGIVLIPLEMLLVVLALIIGYIASGVFIGNKIFNALKKPAIPIVSALIGIVALFLTGFIPVVGDIVKAVFLIAGFGAVVSSRLGTAVK